MPLPGAFLNPQSSRRDKNQEDPDTGSEEEALRPDQWMESVLWHQMNLDSNAASPGYLTVTLGTTPDFSGPVS